MAQETLKRKRELPPRGSSRPMKAKMLDSLAEIPAHNPEDAQRSITVKALNGKKYTIGPLPDDPSEVTFHAGKETILEAIRGKPE